MAIISTPVPVDMRALRALKHSPLQLDLYAWATYTAYVVSKSRESRFVAWRWLHEQFGADYTALKDFKKHARGAMARVASVYPALVTRPRQGGFDVLPSSLPSVLALPAAMSGLPDPPLCLTLGIARVIRDEMVSPTRASLQLGAEVVPPSS